MAVIPLNLDEQQQRDFEQQAAQAAEGRKRNVDLFLKLFLGLGSDVIKAANSNHRAEIDEALQLASYRWNRLADMQAQVTRDAATLVARPRQRPADPNDWRLPESAIAKLDAEYDGETQARKAELDRLRKEATAEQRALEALKKG